MCINVNVLLLTIRLNKTINSSFIDRMWTINGTVFLEISHEQNYSERNE